MNLHEYQAKNLLSRFGLPILGSTLCYTPNEAKKGAENIGCKDTVSVIKAQVHAGGRGKAGGVKIAKNSDEAREVSSKILGMTLVTPQTGKEGKLVRKVLVEQGTSISKEYYLSLLIDRKNACVSIIASQEGGMEIEEVAHTNPEKILTIEVPFNLGLQQHNIRKIVAFLQLPKEAQSQFNSVMDTLYRAFLTLDCSMLEINPLILTADNKIIILDAKVAIDDNALYRQSEISSMMDYDEIDEREIQANQLGISYVALDGNIGCMVNGAGLAMATMDVIKMAGGEPANFLDVGGGASKETVTNSFKLILRDKSVKAILVNIFGGIMRCDVIAEGVVAAAKELNISVPLVVRLEGTNVDLGKKILAESGLKIIPADNMADAATKVVNSVK